MQLDKKQILKGVKLVPIVAKNGKKAWSLSKKIPKSATKLAKKQAEKLEKEDQKLIRKEQGALKRKRLLFITTKAGKNAKWAIDFYKARFL